MVKGIQYKPKEFKPGILVAFHHKPNEWIKVTEVVTTSYGVMLELEGMSGRFNMSLFIIK